MHKLSYLFILLLLAGCGSRFNQRSGEIYTYSVDLKNLNEGRASVEMQIEGFKKDTAEFVMAAFSPRIYERLQYEELISDLQAVSSDGSELDIKQTDSNRWKIGGARKLSSISYQLSDSREAEIQDKYVQFLSEENLFERGKGIQFIPAASLGYLDNGRADSIQVNITKPFGLFAASGLETIKTDGESVSYSVHSLAELFNYPVLLTNDKPQSFTILNTKVQIGLFSETDKVSKEQLLPPVKKAMNTIEEYIERDLPVQHYSFQFYFYDDEGPGITSSNYHSSSIWVMPENAVSQETFEETIYQKSLEEFLHIYAPQNVQSAGYRDFDFDTYKSSKSLWMVEGATKYLAQHAQINRRKISEKEFQDRVNSFLARSQEYRNEIPLTELSRNVLNPEFQDQLGNIEVRGFLVSLLLDIKLRSSTNGQRGLKQMMQVLAREYGADKSFPDDNLFTIMSGYNNSKDLTTFYQKYIAGTDSLPLEQMLSEVGYSYDEETQSIQKEAYAGQEEIRLRLSWLYGN